MPRSLEQIDTALAALEARVATLQSTVTSFGQTVTQQQRTLTGVSAEVQSIKNGLAVIPAPASSLAKTAEHLGRIVDKLDPLADHAGNILAVQAGSLGVREVGP